MRIAVDIGGTFTDLVAVDDDEKVSRSKALTTPDDLAREVRSQEAAHPGEAGSPVAAKGIVVVDSRVADEGAGKTEPTHDRRRRRPEPARVRDHVAAALG